MSPTESRSPVSHRKLGIFGVVALIAAGLVVGTAWLSVHSLSFAPESSRARMPVATIRTAPINATTPNMPSFRRETGGRGSVGMRHLR